MTLPQLHEPTFHAGLAVVPDFTAPDIIQALQRPMFEGWTGRLMVFPQRFKIHLNEGQIAAIEGHKLLGEWLVETGRLERRQLDRALRSSHPLGLELVEEGLIKATELQKALHEQVSAALAKLQHAPPTLYNFKAKPALVGPHAGFTLRMLLAQQVGGQRQTTFVTDDMVLRLAKHNQTVILCQNTWELLRWFNGRRTLARVMQLSQLAPHEARDIVGTLVQEGLLEKSAISDLARIVVRLKPASGARQPPASIRANLFIKQLTGENTMQDIIDRLRYPLEEAALLTTSLYRDDLIELLSGQDVMQRLLEEY